MTPQDAAIELHGTIYGNEGSKELFARMKKAGLVAVFGASDDLVELRGGIYDEIDAYGGTTFYVSRTGIVKNECSEGDECPNWRQHGVPIEAVWAPGDDVSWAYKTDIPCAQFDVTEDGEVYCRGIVFRLEDC